MREYKFHYKFIVNIYLFSLYRDNCKYESCFSYNFLIKNKAPNDLRFSLIYTIIKIHGRASIRKRRNYPVYQLDSHFPFCANNSSWFNHSRHTVAALLVYMYLFHVYSVS